MEVEQTGLANALEVGGGRKRGIRDISLWWYHFLSWRMLGEEQVWDGNGAQRQLEKFMVSLR